jgi:uncharacterized protein
MDSRYELLVLALARQFGDSLKAVVLFGSQARGEATPQSDHDVFMVAGGLAGDPLSRTRQVRGAIADRLADLPGAINLHAKTPAEFEADLTPLTLDVCVDGICLFGEQYFEPFRRKALSALAASRMIRKRVGRSLFWMLPELRAVNWELTWDGYRERH